MSFVFIPINGSAYGGQPICQENFAKHVDKYTWHRYNEAMTIKLGK